jgi:hypothetical protein
MINHVWGMVDISWNAAATLAVMVRTHFALAGEVLSELAYNGSNTTCTAPDSCTAANRCLFDHLVGAGK